ncbi:MAG: DUF1513 domain-containing protein [Pseudomonadota bacterium]
MEKSLIDRRAFLAGAGGGLLSCISLASAEAVVEADAIFASAYRAPDGGYGIVTLTDRGEILHTYGLPSRGHDIVWKPNTGTMAAFARRPGSFAMVVDTYGQASPTVISTPVDRHFYGHGCFSPDGRLLFATENDFDNAAGVIGVYDASEGYRRIGEFPSGGVGPHDVVMMPDNRTLAIANGGIETHPAYPRAKLNLASMRPNLSLLDTDKGQIVATVELPTELHKLSIRHLAVDSTGRIWFACQNEGDIAQPQPLLGTLDAHLETSLVELSESEWAMMRGYIGSVACSVDGALVAVTSPRGGVARLIDTEVGSIIEDRHIPDVCGIAIEHNKPIFTSGAGSLEKVKHDLAFDNHVSLARQQTAL